MVGASRVTAQVAADIDYSETEEAREQYGPDPAKVRSEQISEDTQRGAKTAAGVPGATSNTPPAQSTNPKQIGRASCRESVCPYVSLSVAAVTLKKKRNKTIPTATD